jgi:synaptosomal-associated protein 25
MASSIRDPNEAEQLQARALQITDESLDSTRRMVKLVVNSEEAGAKSLAELLRQGEQLNNIEITVEKVGDNVDEAHDALKGCYIVITFTIIIS